jgi:hypothetical protein
MRDLRNSPKAHLFDGAAGICELGWQGDFGKGVITGSGTYSEPGANPWVLYGPVAAGSTSVDAFQAGYGSNAIPQIQFRLGMVISGDFETEWVFCRLSVSGPQDLVPGLMWQIDENYTATLATTSARVLGIQLGFSYMFAPATATGVYYGWLARAGRLICQAAASSLATGNAETTATAGVPKWLVTHTAGSASTAAGGCNAWGASSNITFKADTVSGSPILQNLNSQISVNGSTGGLTDILPGAVITGTGMPSNAIISAIDNKGPGGSYRAFIGTNTTGAMFTAQNATATNLQTTLTITNMVQALVYWPTESILN